MEASPLYRSLPLPTLPQTPFHVFTCACTHLEDLVGGAEGLGHGGEDGAHVVEGVREGAQEQKEADEFSGGHPVVRQHLLVVAFLKWCG